jgi:hypothetical protein
VPAEWGIASEEWAVSVCDHCTLQWSYTVRHRLSQPHMRMNETLEEFLLCYAGWGFASGDADVHEKLDEKEYIHSSSVIQLIQYRRSCWRSVWAVNWGHYREL